MALSQTMTIADILDRADVNGTTIKTLFQSYTDVSVTVTTVNDEPPEDTSKTTDFVKILIPGSNGKTVGGDSPTLGIIGRNGAIGGRPTIVGMVSDADGPIGAFATALKLAQMRESGDVLSGDVIITSHISTDVSVDTSHTPPFMRMPVSSGTMNTYEVDPDMDAILSIDASKGNSIIKQRGFAISPTAIQGYILKMSADLIDTMQSTTGRVAVTFPIAIQDITPYDNGISHFNSIMQPHVATSAPVVGVAVIAESVVAGSASSANHETDLAETVQFCQEVAKRFTSSQCAFYDEAEFEELVQMYIPLTVFQTYGNQS